MKKLPPSDWKFSLSSRISEKTFPITKQIGLVSTLKLRRHEFIEKIIFVGLISIIFAQVFPNFRGTNLEVFTGVTLIILVNAVFSYMIMQSSRFNNALASNFFLMFVVNTFAALTYAKIMVGRDNQVSFLVVMFFAYILTLITVLYDRFRPYYNERFGLSK